MNAPLPNEYAPLQANYVQIASNRGDIVKLLNKLKDDTYEFLTQIPRGKASFAYAEGKWTVKQVVSHMIDSERIFAYRLLCFSRGERKELPSFDQDQYVFAVDAEDRSLKNLADEFKAAREANLYLFNNLTPEQLTLTGSANGYFMTVNGLLYVIAGHEMHHLGILRDRYL
jgi:uncharacterized damage-inducible protein DinB